MRKRAEAEAWIERAELDADPRDGWQARAACIGLPSTLMYPGPFRGAADDALRMCRHVCPVTLSCLHAAARTEHREHPSHIFGVRGGLTAQQRGIAYQRARNRRRIELEVLTP